MEGASGAARGRARSEPRGRRPRRPIDRAGTRPRRVALAGRRARPPRRELIQMTGFARLDVRHGPSPPGNRGGSRSFPPAGAGPPGARDGPVHRPESNYQTSFLSESCCLGRSRRPDGAGRAAGAVGGKFTSTPAGPRHIGGRVGRARRRAPARRPGPVQEHVRPRRGTARARPAAVDVVGDVMAGTAGRGAAARRRRRGWRQPSRSPRACRRR
jgi:hypothetical protein